ncbi:hypothetical protein I302_102619 [Kwoniella bestiolae CBS 10118]|uniref:Uncharacterized protein n=1 Tax=Kwoniella bestiolae CBS 10118 TaxID=1296100 RepID=A0A1B9GFU0_9TREE|nr:hypothetical protein I302_01308 [Kwoniella bestiolae CBS 10118]OCF29795.1 hypothetical protein I302_01308 [Kwoniella bestiolae CBS 10118]
MAYYNSRKETGTVKGDAWAEGYEKFKTWKQSKAAYREGTKGLYATWFHHAGGKEIMGISGRINIGASETSGQNEGQPASSTAVCKHEIQPQWRGHFRPIEGLANYHPDFGGEWANHFPPIPPRAPDQTISDDQLRYASEGQDQLLSTDATRTGHSESVHDWYGQQQQLQQLQLQEKYQFDHTHVGGTAVQTSAVPRYDMSKEEADRWVKEQLSDYGYRS